MLGAFDQFGSITPGKLAVVTVYKDGVGYDAGKLIESVKGIVGIR